ncbi:SDR family NAD(P)-dependent oxidoreductase [Neisseria animalis]|uniref:SDR family NAD(P)-dependent oxidoreductase n=1 Tax=Neisseria animalis TaxID=492 RepID=A0A5P3MRY4_NEIAN|nr:SDR family NAD(P)-dependent oxidoreductase [Neisseria animalis]QEY24366.1 SDR family NAD(P)-dependent oxidoreductase [Neisseria animalis]ROW31724.1 SDR family NAD(P)-dependent oxidoreductase [Neisseria animalis]VEE06888.1 Uncharacterised protein [Neisseria animalis]
MSNTPPNCAILGFGYLGRPLAQKLYERGAEVAAVKRSLSSDDINLPIRLDTADLNHPDVFQEAFWQQYWADKTTWFCLLPPSALKDYCGSLRQWVALAEQFGVQHIVFCSSTGVYGERVRECDEHTPPEPQTDNARHILAVETLLWESRIPNIDILRLGGLYSAERHPVSRLLLQKNISGGKRPVNVVHQDRAVDALLQTAFDPQGRKLRNIVEPDHPGRAEFYAAEAAKLGLPPPDFNPEDISGGKIVRSIFQDRQA